jgi:hypothetical protein
MNADPTVTVIRLYVWYLKTGAPYGDSTREFVRWVRARHRQGTWAGSGETESIPS